MSDRCQRWFRRQHRRYCQGYTALIVVIIATGVVLCAAMVAEASIDERISIVFSQITAIILAGLAAHYVTDGMVMIGLASL